MPPIFTPVGGLPSPVSDSLGVVDVDMEAPDYVNNQLIGYVIAPSALSSPGQAYLGQGSSIYTSPQIASALSQSDSRSLFDYLDFYLTSTAATESFANDLDYLNGVIGSGPGEILDVLVETGNGTGTDLKDPIKVTAEEAADDTQVLAVTATGFYGAGSMTGLIAAAPGSDLALEIDDSAANVATNLPTILNAIKGYGDFVHFTIDVADTGINIGASLLSIENALDTIGSTVDQFFETNDFSNYDFVTVNLQPLAQAPIEVTVGDYQALVADASFTNLFYRYSQDPNEPFSTPSPALAIVDTGADIAAMSALPFTGSDLLVGGGSFITLVEATDGSLALPLNLAAAISEAGVEVVASPEGSITVRDLQIAVESATPEQIAALAVTGFTAIVSTDGPVDFDIDQATAILQTFAAGQIGLRPEDGAGDGGGVAVVDDAANLEQLSADDLVHLEAEGFSGLFADGGQLSLTVAQALAAAEDAGGPLLEVGNDLGSTGGPVLVSDTMQALDALSTVDIAALGSDGFGRLVATDGLVEMSVAQVAAVYGANLTVAGVGLVGDVVPVGAIVDAADEIEAIQAQDFAKLSGIGFTELAATDRPLQFDVAQALTIEMSGLDVAATSLPDPDGDVGAFVIDATAAFQALTTDQITALADDGFKAFVANDGTLGLTVDQALAVVEGGIFVESTDGTTTTSGAMIVDTAEAIDALTPEQISNFGADYFTALMPQDAPLDLSVLQTQALLDAGIVISGAAPSTVEDTGDDIGETDGVEGLTAGQITALPAAGIGSITATGALQLSTAQALAIAAAGIDGSDDTSISIGDTATKIAALADGDSSGGDILGTLAGALATPSATIGLTATDGQPLDLSLAGALAAGANAFTVSDAAGIMVGAAAADFAGLAATDYGMLAAALAGNAASPGQVAATLAVTDGSPLALGLNDALLAAGDALRFSDAAGVSAAAAAAAYNALPPLDYGALAATLGVGDGVGQVGARLAVTDGQALDLSLPGAIAAGQAALTFVDPAGAQARGAAAAIGALTGGDITDLKTAGIAALLADGSVQMPAATAVALEDPVALDVPAGDTVALTDLAADVEALTPAQIAGLAPIGVEAIDVTDASLVVDVAQAVALLSADLSVAVPAGDGLDVLDTQADLAGLTPQQMSALQTDGFQFTTACYAAGTRIMTDAGHVAIEHLREGDRVMTVGGATRPARWLGWRRVAVAGHPRPWDVMPVRVRTHAFGPGTPVRDLILSPDHAVFVEGVLIPVRHLVNGATVLQENVAEIVWWHIELDVHDVILAEGLPAESYLDTGNRSAFANGTVTALHPSFKRTAEHAWSNDACAPLAEDGPILAAAQRRLASQATDMGLSLPVVVSLGIDAPGRAGLTLPAEADIIRLVSGSARQGEDRRCLGALVRGVRIDHADVGLHDMRLGAGFHDVEVHGAQAVRWTNGCATITVGRGAHDRLIEIDIAAVIAQADDHKVAGGDIRQTNDAGLSGETPAKMICMPSDSAMVEEPPPSWHWRSRSHSTPHSRQAGRNRGLGRSRQSCREHRPCGS